MKELKLSQFYKGDFLDKGYELYLVRDGEGQVMYIGISRDSIWRRWFGGGPSHLDTNTSGKVYGKSYFGEVIERRFPGSWDWIIELWTREDCLQALEAELTEKNLDKVEIDSIEPHMIAKFEPLYNVMYGGGRHEDPLTTEKLDRIYKDLFE